MPSALVRCLVRASLVAAACMTSSCGDTHSQPDAGVDAAAMAAPDAAMTPDAGATCGAVGAPCSLAEDCCSLACLEGETCL